MRLDRLPKDVATKDDLQYYLNLSVPLADAVHSLAENRPVLVLIDQLDALCDMMTTPTKRLALILNTVRDLARMPRVKVVLAVRPFEYQYSVQLRGVKVRTSACAAKVGGCSFAYRIGRCPSRLAVRRTASRADSASGFSLVLGTN